LKIAFDQAGIKYVREYYFKPTFRGISLQHRLFVDFLCKEKIFLECKAIEKIGMHERLQLWNYMRAGNIRIGILYNFAPVLDECEKYYYDPETRTISYF
jgi:GxxExxY protein